MDFHAAQRELSKLSEPKTWPLSRMKRLVKRSGVNLDSFQCVLVGGTNGKGSVCAFLDSVLRAQGYSVGFYSSPHLLDVRERIRVGGKLVSKKDFAALAAWALPFVKKQNASYFEALTLMALRYFALKKVDWAVLEVGLGGRLDATNVVRPKLSVITNVELEHADRLGKTVASIAKEKAGIIKTGQWACVTAARKPAFSVIQSQAKMQNVTLVSTQKNEKKDQIVKKSALVGRFQEDNLAVALECISVLRRQGVVVSQQAVLRGVSSVEWPGRFQRFGRVVVDGAHNPAGIDALVDSLDRTKKYALVFGVLNDKNYPKMIKSLRTLRLSRVYLVTPPTPRAVSAERLLPFFQFVPAEVSPSVDAALEKTRVGAVLVCGSLFMAAQALSHFGNKAKKY